jgi:hypothetical protein
LLAGKALYRFFGFFPIWHTTVSLIIAQAGSALFSSRALWDMRKCDIFGSIAKIGIRVLAQLILRVRHADHA